MAVKKSLVILCTNVFHCLCHCGCLGHVEKECDIRLSISINESGSFQYGAWLHAETSASIARNDPHNRQYSPRKSFDKVFVGTSSPSASSASHKTASQVNHDKIIPPSPHLVAHPVTLPTPHPLPNFSHPNSPAHTSQQDMNIVVPHNVSSHIAAPTIVPHAHQPPLPNSPFMTNITQLGSPVARAFKRYRKLSSVKSGPKQKPSKKTQATKQKLNMFKPVDEDNNRSDTNSPSLQPLPDPNNAPAKKHKPNSILSHPLAFDNMVSGSQKNSSLVLATTVAADS